MGNDYILRSFKKFQNNPKFVIYPSLRFEYFLILLKHAEFIIGNSSAGIREAPYYGVPTINIGSRQNNRSVAKDIINTDYSKESILAGILKSETLQLEPIQHFGEGKSDELFMCELKKESFWQIPKQKYFLDI